jgi:hypothetical protein
MNGYVANYQLKSENNHLESSFNHYYSVEFTLLDNELLYQFKLWNSGSQSLFILVREDSGILQRIKEGGVFKTKYYSTDSLCPPVDSETQIKGITRDNNGCFKGHYLVELSILKTGNQPAVH